MSALAVKEQTRFVALERTIERGLGTFVEVGNALMEIRDHRLYRIDHRTFEGYCRERWGFSRQRAHQLTDAAEVAGVLSTTVDTGPASERQARELAPLKDQPEAMAEAWREANTNGQPTAEQVREAVQRKLPGPKTADRQARETGQPVEASDGRIYLGKDAENSDWLKFRQWAEDIDSMLPADQLVVPSFGEGAYEHARRVRDYATDFLLHNGKAKA